MNKEVFIFPYINLKKIIKMDDFEIFPFESYDFSKEDVTENELLFLTEFVSSFRETFFADGESPKEAKGVGILKYNGAIFRTNENTEGYQEKIKILFLLLKLHISHDFFNSGMSHIDVQVFDIFSFNLANNLTNKFGNMGECKKLHTTVPLNIHGIGDIKFYPLRFCINNIPVEFKIFGGGDEIFGIDPNVIDITSLYKGISKDIEYYKKFLNISSVHYGLEQQNDLFFYFSIIPSIIEILLQMDSREIKKQKAIEYGKKLDGFIIHNNDEMEILTHTHKGREIKEKLGLIARIFVNIYDLRNDFLHEGKRNIEKLKISYKGYDLKIYDVFQLILKYKLLTDFIEKGIIKNDFDKLEFEGSVWTTGSVKIFTKSTTLFMDEELQGLVKKAKSDKELEIE